VGDEPSAADQDGGRAAAAGTTLHGAAAAASPRARTAHGPRRRVSGARDSAAFPGAFPGRVAIL